MKKYSLVIYALLALLLVSCFGKDKAAGPVSHTKVEKTIPKDNGKHINSIDLSEYKNEVTDKLDIWFVDRKEIGDSLEMHYRLDFSMKGKVVKSFPVILDYDDHGEWSAYGNAITDVTEKQHDSRFISAAYGYAACGYAQTEIKFFAADGDILIFDRNVSMVDGVYYSGQESMGEFTAGKANTIYTRYADIDAAENSTDSLELLDITFKDSVMHHYDGKTWTRQALTKKGEVYRKLTMPEDKYLKSLEE